MCAGHVRPAAMAEEERALLGSVGADDGGGSAEPVRSLSSACDPRRLPHRLIVLALMCFLGFGSYFCYDNPAALQTQVQRDMKVNTAQFMALYAWYSWPNVVLCFFGGFLIDRVFGIRLGTIIFSIFVCVGQVVFALGALLNTFWLMDAGRFIFGWCNMSLFTDVCINPCLSGQESREAPFQRARENRVFFIEKFKFSPQEAGAINSIVYIISAPMSPVFGLLVDKLGKNIIWVLCAVITTLASHIMLAFTFWNPWIAMCLLGVAYSLLACALWPMVAFVVPEHQLGTAYGFMQSIQNLGLAIIAIAAGMILDTRGYLFLEVFFSACVCLSLIAVVMLYFVNHLTGGDLNWSAKKREKLQKAAATEAEEQERLRRQNEDDLAKLRPKADDFSLRNKYLSKLGAQLPDNYCSYLSTMAHRSVLK
ncbi:major facilitator superfamily domain-containing protein 1 isoform X5 [Neopsephotus bourkii]|uniref:major facilitator superfamily domain-containing protein 1 isoform X5 n=1 Tax=Neopsephotus bourkii TaxID=309878 RepID=UPI002AA51872|nr:major facilitator superfamily domain-containing protein 1 isoform X5 [Neopsephotus bourkii]